ncbi:hypothetical protein AB0M39_21685 [Streptomyces sp. NPDC051907]|uniref:hypothetical protein n=1 Tax=Streptomyces sp. NPDC051907 TaxID=3155284 RepID=UPI00342831FA
MELLPLGRAGAGAVCGEVVGLKHDYFVGVVAQDARSEQSGKAAAQDYGSTHTNSI